jgi:hypothetical protein
MRRAYFVCLFLCLTATFLLSQSNPVPLVNQPLVPDAAVPGGSGFTLTVNGTQFVSSSVVNWNGTALATNFVSGSQLTATVPASDIVTPNTASVTVSNPVPGGGTSNVVLFTTREPATTLAFATSTLSTGLAPTGMVVADFNGDGKPDLAVLNYQTDSPCPSEDEGAVISILLGNGDGTFSNHSTLCFPVFAPFATTILPQLLAGDFNGDGKTDLLGEWFSEGGWSLAVFPGNGDGTFESPESSDADGNIFAMVAADLNGDGKLDLAAAGYFYPVPNVVVFLGSGGYFDGASYGVTPAWLYSNSLAVGDFNRDGILDLASVGAGSSDTFYPYGPVSIFLGNGNGSTTPAVTQPSVTMVNASSVTAGDFNGDGILDLAIADAGSTTFKILQGNGDGTFKEVSGEPPLPSPANLVATADFNEDGKLDLVFFSGNTISIYLGNGDGTFRAGWVQASAPNPYPIGIADFNGDGLLDLVFANASDNTISILSQTTAPPGVSVTLATGQDPSYVNQPVTYATVVSASPITPTGSVTFKQGSTILGTVPLDYGQAIFTTTFTKAGSFSIVASYSGDENYPAKNSQAVKQVVNKYTSNTGVASSLNPSVYGQAVNLTSVVTSEAPTGTVTFKNWASSLGTVPLVDGVALLTKTNLPAGTLPITATYNGDTLDSKSTSPALIQVVDQATTTTTVASSPNPSTVGRNVKFTATVKSPTVVAIGTVTFSAGTTTLGTVRLAGGKGSLITSVLPAGTTTVTATYDGTSNITGSSGSVVQTVN